MKRFTIKELRQRLEMSQQQLGDCFGLAGANVSRWERGETIPSPQRIKVLAQIFGVTPAEIDLTPQGSKQRLTEHERLGLECLISLTREMLDAQLETLRLDGAPARP